MTIAEKYCNKLETKEIDADRPSTLLYCYFSLAQLYYQYHDYEKGLETINKAIDHTPTMPELYVIKAKIQKGLGLPQEASDSMNEARKLDLYDRYLNIRCVKYLLKADKHDEALNTMALFLKKEDGDFPLQIHELQNAWYELEKGRSYMRLGEYGKAMKQFMFVNEV